MAQSKRESALVEAAQTGDKARVLAALAIRNDLDEQDALGCTALQVAVQRWDAEMVRYLLELGANPRAPASALAQCRAYERLGEAADSPRGPPTLLHALGVGAAYPGSDVRGVALALIDQGLGVDAPNPDGSTPLHVAVVHRKAEAIAALVDLNANLHARDRKGRAPLAHATSVSEVRQLLDAGADPNEAELNFQSADVLRVLLEAGADPKQQPQALYVAADRGNEDAVQVLLEHGAELAWEVPWISHDGTPGGVFRTTALEAAARMGRVAIAEGLVKAGTADLAPALGEAAWAGHKEIVEMLLAHGADPNAPGRTGPALCAAARDGHVEIIALLLRAGARVDVRDPSGDTPLTVASRSGVVAAVRALLHAGADPRAANADGTTAESAARKARIDPDLLAQFPGRYDHLEILRELRAASGAEARSASPPLPDVPQPPLPAKLPPKVQSPAANVSDLDIGDAVEHPRFGSGTVIDVEGVGPAARVTVEMSGLNRTLPASSLRRCASPT